MTDHASDQQQRPNGPCGKIMFPAKSEAREFVEFYRRKHGIGRFPISIRYYHCKGCDAWHFTRKPFRHWESGEVNQNDPGI